MKERIACHNEWLMHVSDAEAGKMWCSGGERSSRRCGYDDAEAGKMKGERK